MDPVIGIDPGLNYTGWGIVSFSDNTFRLIDSGVIKNKKSDSAANKLWNIYQNLDQIFSKFKISAISLEITFVNNNPMSALSLGYSRSIVLMLSAKHSIPLFEYAPTVVKKALTGSGKAAKEQVLYMVEKLLNIKVEQTATMDVSDALALSICHLLKGKGDLS